MIHFIICDAITGLVSSFGSNTDLTNVSVPDGSDLHEVQSLPQTGLSYVYQGGQITAIDPRPSPFHEWNGSSWFVANKQGYVDAMNSMVSERRRILYSERSDPIFFDYQRGEATREDWEDAVDQIRLEEPFITIDDV